MSEEVVVKRSLLSRFFWEAFSLLIFFVVIQGFMWFVQYLWNSFFFFF